MTAPLQYLLITRKEVALEKVSFSDRQILRLFFNTLTVDEKYYLLYRDNLTQPSGIQLYQEKKNFPEFFFF